MGGRSTVVLAEDDPGLQDLVRFTLESDGHAVEAYGTGDDCWERLTDGERPDVVVLDITLPGMDGMDILERLRRDDELAEIPVMFLSAREKDDDAVADFAAEADDYVTKPFSPSELRTRIDRLL